MKINLTKLEADALHSCAGHMKDDIEDYFDFMTKNELKKFRSAYESGMQKLSEMINKKSQPNTQVNQLK